MILKKLISILLIFSTLAIFTSCANGKSLPYYILKQKNTTEELLKEGNTSYTEKIEYYKNCVTKFYVYFCSVETHYHKSDEKEECENTEHYGHIHTSDPHLLRP